MTSPLFDTPLACLSRLLSPVSDEETESRAAALLSTFGTLERVLSSDTATLVGAGLSRKDAEYLKITLALAARRVTDRFAFGVTHTEEELRAYLPALFAGTSRELVYMFLLDKEGRFLSAELVSEGTVNSSGITPRRFLDVALKRDTATVILAHNHPSGRAVASVDDIRVTEKLAGAFRSVGIRLARHFIVAGAEVGSVEDSGGTVLGETVSFFR